MSLKPLLDLSLERCLLVAPFTLGELIEALVLYRNVEIITDDDYGIVDVMDFFGTSNFAQLFSEFHESMEIKLTINSLDFHPGRSGHLIDVRQYFSLGSNYAYMLDHQVLLGHPRDGTNMMYQWNDPKAASTLDHFHGVIGDFDFIPNLFGSEGDLSFRFRAYLAAQGIHFQDLAVKPTKYGSLNFDWPQVEIAGKAVTHLDKHFSSFVSDSYFAYLAAMNSQAGHLVLPRLAGRVMALDSIYLMSRIASVDSSRSWLAHAGMAGVPQIAEALAGRSSLPGELLLPIVKARRLRLSMDEELSVDEIVQSLVRHDWLDKLPAKLTRWSIFTGSGAIIDALGAGGLGTLSGVGLSAVDAFLVDRIRAKFRPDQYLLGYRNSLGHVAKIIAKLREE